MIICYFGTYNPNYSRNRILLKGLRENGVKVIECRTNLSGILKYWDLIKKHWKIRKDYDIMITGFAGNHATILAKLITRKPIIFDAYLSFYEAMIFDRKQYSSKSWRAIYFWLIDWLPSKLAYKVLLDTKAHIDYFVETFKISREKFVCLYVGSLPEIFFPCQKNVEENEFVVHFHARGVPLQGIEYVLDAAKELENFSQIKFNIIGNIRKVPAVKKRLDSYNYKNISFIKSISLKELADYINRADIALGIFGNSQKTKRVIPNKVFEAIACGKPVITAKTVASEEIFTNNKHLLFCRLGDGKSIAQNILKLKEDSELRKWLAKNSYQLFVDKFIPKRIAKSLIVAIKNN